MDIREIPRVLFAELGMEYKTMSDGSRLAKTTSGLCLRLRETTVRRVTPFTVVDLDVYWYEPAEAGVGDRQWLEFSISAGGTLEGLVREKLELELGTSRPFSLIGLRAKSAALLILMMRRIAELLTTGGFEVETWAKEGPWLHWYTEEGLGG